MLKLHVGDVPLKPLLITVAREGVPVDLSAETITFRLVSPEGAVINTSAGSLDLSKAAQGKVSYVWPTTTLLTTPGEYKMQLRITSEYTSPGLLKVYRA